MASADKIITDPEVIEEIETLCRRRTPKLKD